MRAVARVQHVDPEPAVHIPDGTLAERVYLPLLAVTAGGVALASARASREIEERPGVLPLTGVLGAFIFAAQLVNFPVLPGVSGHLLGGVLAGILLGPWCATIAMTAVFVLQALWLQDGGVYALGANTFNMGLIATFGGTAVYELLRRALGERRSARGAAAFAASFAAVVAGAAATYAEFAISDPRFRTSAFLGLMLGFHAVIGITEGAITVGVLSYVGRVRPDLLERARAAGDGRRASLWPLVVPILAGAALLVALDRLELGSALPDGLEAAVERGAPGR